MQCCLTMIWRAMKINFEELNKIICDSVKQEDQGHWFTLEPFSPEGLHGFVYSIYNQPDDKYYIGKKNFFHGGKKNYKRNGVKVPNYRYGTQTNWKSYTGSSAELNLDMAKHGKENFLFTILRLYETRGGLSYGEANIQHKLDVLTMKGDNDEAKFYNGNIAAIKYIPKEIGRSP